MVITAILCWIVPAGAQQKERIVTVTYISSENVYLDGGTDDGINVGDTLTIWRDQLKISEVKIIYTADHTSSGRLLTFQSKPQIGDQAILQKSPIKPVEVRPPVIPAQTTRPILSQQERSPASPVRISGNIGLQWYQFLDHSAIKRDFSQPALRLNFKAQNLWNKNYNLRIRLRSDYNRRAYDSGSAPGRREWQNRIYEMSFSYDDPRALFNFRTGRIISNAFSGVGYIDGVLLQYNITGMSRLGVFAGAQPQWQYSDFQPARQKYGLYANFRKGEITAYYRWETTLALVGEYHYAAISREYVYLQSNYLHGKYFSIYQNAEIDVNRYWRKEKSGRDINLSSVLLSANFYITGFLSASLSYDHRQNYYTYEQRSLADSLFDSASRQGVRSTLYWRIKSNFRFTANAGFRQGTNGSGATYSWAGHLIHSNLLVRGLTISGRLAGYSNPFTRGYNPSLLLGKSFNHGHAINIEFGNYFYTLGLDDSNHTNRWLRSTLQFVLPWQLYFYGQYEYDWGQDRQGQIISAELGYHF
jgi:hypothetical protein